MEPLASLRLRLEERGVLVPSDLDLEHVVRSQGFDVSSAPVDKLCVPDSWVRGGTEVDTERGAWAAVQSSASQPSASLNLDELLTLTASAPGVSLLDIARRVPARQIRLVDSNDIDLPIDANALRVSSPEAIEAIMATRKDHLLEVALGLVGRVQAKGRPFAVRFGLASVRMPKVLTLLAGMYVFHRRSEPMAAHGRIAERVGTTMDAFVDRGTSEVILREANTPLPESVASRRRPEHSRAVLKDVSFETPNDATRSEVIAIYADCVPSEALDILTRGDLSFYVPADRKAFLRVSSAKDLELVGPGLAKRFRKRELAGEFAPLTAEVALSPGRPVAAMFRTAAIHELMHALDLALGSDGEAFSESGEWLELYEETLKECRSKNGTLGFPNAYSRTDPKEFFAECLTMFLVGNVNGYGAQEVVTTREDLRRVNPRAYALAEKFFREVVPEARRVGKRITLEQRIWYARESIAALRRSVEEKESFKHLMQLAFGLLQLARLAKDTAAFDELRRVVDRMGDRLEGWTLGSEFIGIIDKIRVVCEFEDELTRGVERREDP